MKFKSHNERKSNREIKSIMSSRVTAELKGLQIENIKKAAELEPLVKLLEEDTKMFCQYTKTLETFYDIKDDPRLNESGGGFNSFDLMRFRSCNGPNPLPSFVTTHSHKIISPRDCREIKGIERFKFIFILAQNWLAYFFVEIHDTEEPHSQASLHAHTKKRPKLFDRVYLCSELINESRKLLRELSDKFVAKFEIPRLLTGLNLCKWENAVVIREFNGWIFPTSTKAVIAFCLFTGMSKAFMDRNILTGETNLQQSSKSSVQSTKKIAKVTPSKNGNWRTNSIIDDDTDFC
jgi:hypothetical protein